VGDTKLETFRKNGYSTNKEIYVRLFFLRTYVTLLIFIGKKKVRNVSRERFFTNKEMYMYVAWKTKNNTANMRGK